MSDTEIIVGDSRTILPTLPEKSVQMCVTSPPYFGLRNYDHVTQIGQEQTPDSYVAQLVDVFRGVRRVLRDDGTLWLNLGDTYTRDARKGQHKPGDAGKQNYIITDGGSRAAGGIDLIRCGMPAKNLLGIPWMVAFALRADGWVLRNDVIWAKPNPIPEGVTDRLTKSHEHIFLLSKTGSYYFDQKAIQEPATCGRLRGSGPMSALGTGRNDIATIGDYRQRKSATKHELNGKTKDQPNAAFRAIRTMRNKRDVWVIPTRGFKGAHFATFPPELIEPCILAGSASGDTVLDPFGGAGTTGLVAEKHGRNALLIELNENYAQMAADRINAAQP